MLCAPFNQVKLSSMFQFVVFLGCGEFAPVTPLSFRRRLYWSGKPILNPCWLANVSVVASEKSTGPSALEFVDLAGIEWSTGAAWPTVVRYDPLDAVVGHARTPGAPPLRMSGSLWNFCQ